MTSLSTELKKNLGPWKKKSELINEWKLRLLCYNIKAKHS